LTDKRWRISDPIFESEKICFNFRIWPWNGHRRFAYDLVSFIKPSRFVELGTYWGTSFFAFCQAIKDFNLQTEGIAVDTWEGDGHTGPYDPEAFETFSRIQKEIFGKLNIRLLKMTFQNALPLVKDKSVDLLHIDGCHDYEAVKQDYETWLPKLNQNGIVLFHDVADSVNYESVRFWKEISKDLPHMKFQHSWGLGILFPKGNDYYDAMKSDNFDDKLKIYEYRSDLDYALVRIDILKKMMEDRKEKPAEIEPSSFSRWKNAISRYLKPTS
jgi:predicted O-methyltransferase YrrM